MIKTEIFSYQQGNSPVIVSFPHDGMRLPPEIAPQLNELGKQVPDTDWYVNRLYNFLPELDVSFFIPEFSRYVVDLNRSSQGGALYPGQYETSVCPVATFDGEPIYREGCEPDAQEVQRRIGSYWQPYHDHIQSEIERIKALHGYAILWDAHSIRGMVPQLFDGVLPHLNFGTGGGLSCTPEILRRVTDIAYGQEYYSVVENARFKGGFITRHYGNPAENVHTIQLEINQSIYMQEGAAAALDEAKCERLRPLLKQFLHALSATMP
ncbi:MAG: N-formylglutamate deformylase [Pseudomonadales bacterium]